MIQITIPTPKGLLIPVVVPLGAVGFKIGDFMDSPNSTVEFIHSDNEPDRIMLDQSLISPVIIGTLMYKDGQHIFDFDPEPFIETVELAGKKRYRYYHEKYQQYAGIDDWNFTATALDSFVSLLQSYGIGLENPLGEKPDVDQRKYVKSEGTDGKEYKYSELARDLEAWRAAESRLLKPTEKLAFVLNPNK